jgi:hypothetical protein
MAERLFEFLRQFFDAYGYWTLVVVLLLENAGIPVPGETTLLFVSFLAWSERELQKTGFFQGSHLRRFDSTREHQLKRSRVFANYLRASKISIQSSSVLSCQVSFARYGRSSC